MSKFSKYKVNKPENDTKHNFTIEISSFVGLFIAILKEQQGVIYKGGGIYNDFPQNVFLKGGIYKDFENFPFLKGGYL